MLDDEIALLAEPEPETAAASGALDRRQIRRLRKVERPNIVLYLIDSMRADRLGRERNGVHLTPNLSAFADEGRVFSRAVAAGIPTYFGFPPMFIGQSQIMK